MEEINKAGDNERFKKEANQLAAVLGEMKAGLDVVTTKVQALTTKIRPIDKKLQYQIQKLTRIGGSAPQQVGSNDPSDGSQKIEDPLNYRPNPNMLISKADTTSEDGAGVYRPPKFAPAVVEEDRKMSREERNALRKEKEALRKASRSAYIREMMDDLEGRPEEVREIIGTESRELTRYMEKMERRAQQEEELFTRAPVTKMDKKIEKHLKKSRNGLLGLTDSFYDEIKTLPLGDDAGEQPTSFSSGDRGMGKLKKRKRKH
ncbi:hypothetical protein DITRI_Ditri10aG0089000 [Diplodiscus trichospermus]